MTLFDFSQADTVQRFSAVDDRVMGGVSKSRMISTAEGTAAFQGHLSLDQGGGFASVRADDVELDLSDSEGVELEVRGDGRTYQLRFRHDGRFDGVNYRARFDTKDGEWQTVRLPFSAFEPTFRGRIVRDAPPLDPARIRQVGFLVADEQEGEFRLEVREISAY